MTDGRVPRTDRLLAVMRSITLQPGYSRIHAMHDALCIVYTLHMRLQMYAHAFRSDRYLRVARMHRRLQN